MNEKEKQKARSKLGREHRIAWIKYYETREIEFEEMKKADIKYHKGLAEIGAQKGE